MLVRRALFTSLILVGCSNDPGLPPLPTIAEVPAFEDINPDPHIVEVNLRAGSATLEVKPNYMTDVLAYNGTLPGPLLEARVGDRIIVHFQNDLAEATTIHWHGLRIPSEQDGNPMVQGPIPAGGSFTYDFTVPDAGTFWFHPHMGTIEQIDRGMYGAIIVSEAAPPKFTAERLYVIDDIRLSASGQISPYAYSGHDVMMGRLGNTLLTNGKATTNGGSPPTATTKLGSIERWRIVNAATARVFEIAVDGASWRVIGTDGGLVPEPFTKDKLLMAPGQRFDLEVTYNVDATAARLVSYDAYTDNPPAVPMALVNIAGESWAKPPVYPQVALPAVTDAALDKEIRLGANDQGFTINDKVGDTESMMELTQGQPVRLTVSNEIGPYHPFHLHGQFFQILTRNGKPADEPGLKDTVLLDAYDKVTLLTYFENPGMWMYHCHIPEHAENGMMAHLMVNPAP